jgi:hypothetical protein
MDVAKLVMSIAAGGGEQAKVGSQNRNFIVKNP